MKLPTCKEAKVICNQVWANTEGICNQEKESKEEKYLVWVSMGENNLEKENKEGHREEGNQLEEVDKI